MSILKREVFYDDTGGVARFWDWALTTTTLGSMAEPFTPDVRRLVGRDIEDFDPTDPMSRIDSIRASSMDTQLLTLSGGQHALVGGVLTPRVGR